MEFEMEDQNTTQEHNDGYTTKEALSMLYQELQAEVTLHKKLESRNKLRYLSGLHHANVDSTYHWTSLLAVSISIILLFLAYIYYTDRATILDSNWWLVEGVILLLSLIINIALVIADNRKNRFEYVRLHQRALNKIKEYVDNHWDRDSYPTLHSPLSPCISLQWTRRDGQTVNLPSVLLAKGDVILMRAGQPSPGYCKQLNVGPEETPVVLYGGDIYNPLSGFPQDESVAPQSRQPVETKRFVMLDTPFIENLRSTLEDKTIHPDSMLDIEKHLISSIWLQRIVLPTITMIMLLTNVIRWYFLKPDTGHWTETILVLLVHACLPLLPVIFPVMYCLLNAYGQARIHGAFIVAKNITQKLSDSFDSTSTISVEEARVDLPWADVLAWFISILFNKAPVVTSKTNILHSLGSVTSFCCVDKKGILSWPSPSPEKIFFLASRHQSLADDLMQKQTSVQTDSVFEATIEEEEEDDENVPKISPKKHCISGSGVNNSIEVLGLSQDPKNVCVLHFDDPDWKTYIDSLKPLGINILLNLCNEKTVEWYSKFSGHVTCEALEKKETVAVINRRCLCYLAKEIGFSFSAIDGFQHEKNLGMYKQVPAEEAAKEKEHRAASHIQHQIPMPHLFSVVVKDKISGLNQLMTQGTADIVLECCSEYWNGQDICPITENDRKKILDFYHRNTMGAYCSAFAYKPVSQKIASHLEDVYLELPESSFKKTSSFKPRSTAYKIFDNRLKGLIEFDSGTETDGFLGSRSFSVDSLMDTESIESITDPSGCYNAQQNQIFIGMITLQYQARQDFVQLIDKLESACIRFVHFSKENELRSRVFSEKMGLEAGWNCHISLLSKFHEEEDMNMSGIGSDGHLEKPSCRTSQISVDFHTKTANGLEITTNNRKSFSAPSLINLESSQVKFVDHTSDILSTDSRSDMESEADLLMKNGGSEGGWETSDDDEGNEYQSDSRYTSSYVTENTDDSLGALDNRAKLPRGIENIRPHIQNVDNVPLLVNLFTDCNVETTKEMITIMQEHGEVVLCVGSALSIHNTPLFLQADCCLAVEPLHPVSCTQHPSNYGWADDEPTPTQIACDLISIPCPLAFRCNDNFSLIHLIAEARHHIFSMRNCFYLMLCYHLSLSLSQVLASCLLLPPVLSSRHLLWLLLIVTPLLGFTMMGNPVDPRIMNLATRKNIDHINLNVVLQFLLQFALRFIPSMVVSLLCYILTLYSYCENVLHIPFSIYQFHSTIGNETVNSWYEKYSGGLVLAQNIMFFLQVLYFICISASFVHWTDHIWKKPPFTNRLWIIITPILLILQIIYSVSDVTIHNYHVTYTLPLSDVHPSVWAISITWILVILAINELVKRREVKLAVRYQKRARLDFDTKLGMNSPF